MSRPNLFHFATSELSQDAFFCWLASCAAPTVLDKELQNAGLGFLNLLTSKAGIELPQQIERIQIRRQLKNIDLVIEINESIAILIEDKAGTSEHSKQLERYLLSAREMYPTRQLAPVYIQTYIQPSFENVKASGFSVVGRRDLIETLPRSARDSILSQFSEHLLDIENQYEAFRFGKSWSFYAWQRYLELISENIPGCEWSYVPNASGGFLAAYWGWTPIGLGSLYLQIAQERLSVRILPHEDAVQAEIESLYQQALEFSEWIVPKRLKPRKGRTQNLVNLEMDHRRFDLCGNILIDETVMDLVNYTEKLVRFAQSP